ncbi:MAG: hypothetical protein J5654_00470 [Victivallales bacterium]|nr:hypothetical protein [Victivallales bacterium]
MNCQECQNELLLHSELSSTAQTHLDNCAECRDFAKLLVLVSPPEPSPELDSRVVAGCRGILAARRHWRRYRQALLGVAAAAAVLLSVTIFHTRSQGPMAPPHPELAVGFAPTAEEYTEALSWDVGVSLSSAELDQVELDLELLTAGL